jgi:hypothetical protein
MEHKMKEGMMDNRMVKEDHQQGIARVMQRKGDLKKGQGGKMGHVEEAHWRRANAAMTPSKA